jgi:sterol desaturase/sphingolipid hydroxylase (fatty acid hydroxylase superfamily)
MIEFVVQVIRRLMDLTWIVLISFGLEWFFSRGPLTRDRQLRGVTYAVTLVPTSVAISLLIWAGVGAFHLAPPVHLRDLPWLGDHPAALIVASVAVSLLLTDFLYYWTHRAQHAIPFLWRFHSLHHSINDLSALNNYSHWSEEAVQVVFKVLPATLLISANMGIVGPFVMVFVHLHESYIHSASRLNLGRWSWLVNDNVRHRVHHSVEPRHFNKNFSINFGFWDHLFGTAYVPDPNEWPDTGLADQPEPASFARFLGWSFRQSRRG